MIHIYKIKRKIWNIINVSECGRRSKIDSVSAMFETTITKNYSGDRRCVKSEKTVDLSVTWVDALESMI